MSEEISKQIELIIAYAKRADMAVDEADYGSAKSFLFNILASGETAKALLEEATKKRIDIRV